MFIWESERHSVRESTRILGLTPHSPDAHHSQDQTKSRNQKLNPGLKEPNYLTKGGEPFFSAKGYFWYL